MELLELFRYIPYALLYVTPVLRHKAEVRYISHTMYYILAVSFTACRKSPSNFH